MEAINLYKRSLGTKLELLCFGYFRLFQSNPTDIVTLVIKYTSEYTNHELHDTIQIHESGYTYLVSMSPILTISDCKVAANTTFVFKREAHNDVFDESKIQLSLLRQVDHPNVVKIYDIVESQCHHQFQEKLTQDEVKRKEQLLYTYHTYTSYYKWYNYSPWEHYVDDENFSTREETDRKRWEQIVTDQLGQATRNPKTRCLNVTTEYCANGSLMQLISCLRCLFRLGENVTRTYFLQLLNGLKAMRDAGIDIDYVGLNSFLLDDNYNLKISGFGFDEIHIRESKKMNVNGIENAGVSKKYVCVNEFEARQIVKGKLVTQNSAMFTAGIVLFTMHAGCLLMYSVTMLHLPFSALILYMTAICLQTQLYRRTVSTN